MTAPYIYYAEWKEFYILKEVCKIFYMKKRELKKKCEIYGILPAATR